MPKCVLHYNCLELYLNKIQEQFFIFRYKQIAFHPSIHPQNPLDTRQPSTALVSNLDKMPRVASAAKNPGWIFLRRREGEGVNQGRATQRQWDFGGDEVVRATTDSFANFLCYSCFPAAEDEERPVGLTEIACRPVSEGETGGGKKQQQQ